MINSPPPQRYNEAKGNDQRKAEQNKAVKSKGQPKRETEKERGRETENIAW